MSNHVRTDEIGKLFQDLDLSYLSRPRIAYAPLHSYDPLTSEYYRHNREEFEALSHRYDECIRSNALAPVYVKEAGGMGLGLFAASGIEEGAFIGEYTGVVREAQSCLAERNSLEGGAQSFLTDFAWEYPDSVDEVELEIDAGLEGNELRFVNHSFAPNLLVEHTVTDGRWVLFFVALRQIGKDEQLFVDYGEAYWTSGHRTLILP